MERNALDVSLHLRLTGWIESELDRALVLMKCLQKPLFLMHGALLLPSTYHL